ncbi:MAG TPA: bifunctional DNA primase/polymerase [Longimicrobium sp.]|nr:bifunctional DNA primase/polymerase [Longimicrobium sp.]
MTAATELRQAAWAAHRAGLCVLPPREDGSKRPLGAAWATYQSRGSTLDELREWFTADRQGLGAVTGAVSGNLEVFEFDDRAVYEQFVAAARASGLGDLIDRIVAGYEEETPNGGIHWPMRCDEIAGNTTLARRPGTGGKVDTLIQTRGEGGYIVLAPSGGAVHPTGKCYRLRRGGFATVARVTPDERRALWQLARGFDELPVRDTTTPASPPRPANSGARPGEDFAARTGWAEILEPHGWVAVFARGDETFWRRPGKAAGISATTNYAGSGLLYVFSSSTPFDAERGYGKFGAFCILNHGGDFAAAARALGAMGYGAPAIPAGTRARIGAHSTAGDATAGEDGAAEAIHLTDMGNGRRLAARHGRDLLYCARFKGWLIWDGQRYAPDETGEIDRRAKDTVGQMYAEAGEIADLDGRKELVK